MKRSTRAFLLILACLLFIITAPLVVLYAIGYRVTGSGTTHPVGVLLVATNPRNATITINGNEIGRSPRAIPNLLPGKVELGVTKDGFRSWHKQVAIEPTKTSDFQNIRLFPAVPVTDRIAEHVERFVLSPNQQLLAVLLPKNIIAIMDSTGLTVSQQINFPTHPEELLWSADSSELLVQTARGQYSVTTASTTPTLLTTFPEGKILGWDPRLPNRVIVLTEKDGVVIYSTITKAVSPLIPKSDSATISTEGIYSISDGVLTRYAYDGTPRQTYTVTLPTTISKMYVSSSGQVAVIDGEGTSLLVNSSTTEEIPAPSATDLGFSPDGTLLYIKTGPTELHLYNVNNELTPYIPLRTTQLLTRLSRPINNISWLAGNDYLLYQVDDELIASEVDTRDHVITTSLDTTNVGDAHAVTDQAGQFMYYIKKSGQDTSLIKMDLIGQ